MSMKNEGAAGFRDEYCIPCVSLCPSQEASHDILEEICDSEPRKNEFISAYQCYVIVFTLRVGVHMGKNPQPLRN